MILNVLIRNIGLATTLRCTHQGGHTMKRKLLALGLFAATCIAAPAFASSSPPTATLDLRPVAAYIFAEATAIDTSAPNITLKVDAADYTYLGAKDAMIMTETTSGPPGWSAGIAKRDARSGGKALVITRAGDEIYGISVGLSPRPGDSTAKFISAAGNVASAGKVLLATAPPANGFAHPDLLAGSVNSVMGLGAA